MTDIIFYVGKKDTLDGRLEIACRLVKMAFDRNLQVHIHTDSYASSQKLDALLWTKDEQRFLPHAVISHGDEINELDKVTLSHEFEPMSNCDYLINLSNQRPDFFSRFNKMAEIIDQSEDILNAGRQRYSFYRERGYTLEYHSL